MYRDYFQSMGRRRPILRSLLLALVQMLLLGCDEAPQVSPVVGNMADTSYYGLRNLERLNGLGQPVTMAQFGGRFVWADYAAPWCSTCFPQSENVKSLDEALGQQSVVFITVMTSDRGGSPSKPATVATAKRWADRFRLDAARVLVANLSSMTLPKHILFSPDGQVLFEHIGYLSVSEIQTILGKYMAAWEDWRDYGAPISALGSPK